MATMERNENKVHVKSKKMPELKQMLDNEEYELRKRLPRKLPKRKCDVYVTRKTDFKGQLERCQKILDNGNEVFVHGLGAAINRALNLALQLKERGMGSVDLAVHTSTVELVDDLEPLTDEHDVETLTRSNSAVHIRIYRPEVPSIDGDGDGSTDKKTDKT